VFFTHSWSPLQDHAGKSNNKYTVVSFQHIRQSLSLVWCDTFFVVGPSVVRRRSGWPMGGALSEPGTIVDHSHDIYDLDHSQAKQTQCGWFSSEFTGLSFDQILAGTMHVDDRLLMSNVLCSACILSCLSRSWPKDVGTSIEETGPLVRFLSAFVHEHRGRLEISFSITLFGFPVALIIPACCTTRGVRGQEIHTFKILHMYMLGRLLSYDYMLAGSDRLWYIHFSILVHELLRLQWPAQWVMRSIRKIPACHSSPFIRAVGSAMKIWRSVRFQAVFLLSFLQLVASEAVTVQALLHYFSVDSIPDDAAPTVEHVNVPMSR